MFSPEDPRVHTFNVFEIPEGRFALLERRLTALEAHRDATIADISEQDAELKALSDAMFVLGERLKGLEERGSVPADSAEFVQGVTSRLGSVYDAIEDLESFLLNR